MRSALKAVIIVFVTSKVEQLLFPKKVKKKLKGVYIEKIVELLNLEEWNYDLKV